jgi:hypothetical protein
MAVDQGKVRPSATAIRVCKQRVGSPARTFIAPWPLNDGPRVLFITVPSRGIVMTWRDVLR